MSITVKGTVAKIDELKTKKGEAFWKMRIVDPDMEIHDLVQFRTKPDIKKGDDVEIKLDEKTTGFVKTIKVNPKK